MNFLAHALLSGNAEADRVGGLMGDFVKGPLPAGLPPDLASGVALHRAIDSFADRHPAFAASRAESARRGGASAAFWSTFFMTTCWHATGRITDRAHSMTTRPGFTLRCTPAPACCLKKHAKSPN